LIILLDMTKLLDFSTQPGNGKPSEAKTEIKAESKTEVRIKTSAAEARGTAASK
jgi:hypothetical protein